jgi:hypothetical protein
MVREQIAEKPMLTTIIEPMLAVLLTTREQLAVFDRLVHRRARTDNDVRRLMTVPGVRAVIALAYTTTVEDPARFKRSSSVAAYLGLTDTYPTPHPSRLDDEGYVIAGASAANLPNSSGVNARTVVVRAFPDDVIATANWVIASPFGISTTKTTSY